MDGLNGLRMNSLKTRRTKGNDGDGEMKVTTMEMGENNKNMCEGWNGME
jgi:hypothetical protein